jgi:hypothetical protein
VAVDPSSLAEAPVSTYLLALLKIHPAGFSAGALGQKLPKFLRPYSKSFGLARAPTMSRTAAPDFSLR